MNDTAPENPIEFDRSADGVAGKIVELSPLVRRILAPNPGPMTFTGTCSYIVGRGKTMVIDPGPDDQTHRQALIEALEGETITHILVTHTHNDHSPNARALSQATGAKIIGCGPYKSSTLTQSARDSSDQEASHDLGHWPEWRMTEGDKIEGDGFTLCAIETPGHTANHLCFALPQENALFSGDHVMAWSTTVVAPPDGNMRAYMDSLEKLRTRHDRIFWPGHGGPVASPQSFLRGLIQHRHARENAIFSHVIGGDSTIPQIVAGIYKDLDPRLAGAARYSVMAHLEALCERGLLRADPALGLNSRYFKA